MCNFFVTMAIQFQEIIALPSRGKNCMCSMPCTGNATSSERLPKCCKLLNHGYTCNFLPPKAMQFQEIIALPSWVKNCMCIMSCPGNATSSEKLPKYCKCLMFWQFICQQILLSLCVAGLQFFCAMATQ